MLNIIGGLIILGGLLMIAWVPTQYPDFGAWPLWIGIPLVAIGAIALLAALLKPNGESPAPMPDDPPPLD